jgi:hypothetical protein
MVGRRWGIGACVMLAGCNLLSGAADLVTGADDAGPGSPGALDGAVTPDGEALGPDGGDGSDGTVEGKDGAVRPGSDASDASDAGPPPRPDGGRFVFVTSGQTTGDLKGAAGADMTCGAIATDAGLGGVWMAWVTTSAGGASTRLTSAGPWYLVTGTRVATSKAELSNVSMLEHAIDRDELGGMRINSPVWTGGSFVFASCTDWTSAAPGAVGTVGNTQFTNPAWQEMTTVPCNTLHRLYCFEN